MINDPSEVTTLENSLRLLQAENQRLVHELEKQRNEVTATCGFTMNVLVNLFSARDRETGGHLKRVQEYVLALGTYLRPRPGFTRKETDDWIAILARAVSLHDIGKAGIPDAILLKPDRLTAQEYDVMKRHCQIGRDIIDSAISGLPEPAPEKGADSSGAGAKPQPGNYLALLGIAKELTLSHHERWDGTGYPHGLAANAIPYSARLVAVVDVFDAMTAARVYRVPVSIEVAMDHISLRSGSHFDPEIVEAFLKARQQLERIVSGKACDGEPLQGEGERCAPVRHRNLVKAPAPSANMPLWIRPNYA